MENIFRKIENDWPYFAGLAAVLMLGAAHAFEEFGKLHPCLLCLHQREVYWAALSVSVIAIIIRHFNSSKSMARAFDALLAIVFLASALVAGFHFGVEQHWWKGLAGCSGGTIDPNLNILDSLSKPMAAVSCDKIPWSFIGISMAGWNVLISLFLAILSIKFAIIPAANISISANQKGDA